MTFSTGQESLTFK